MNNKTYDPQAESLQVFWASQQERLDLLSGMTITDDILHHTAAFGDSEIRAFEKLMQTQRELAALLTRAPLAPVAEQVMEYYFDLVFASDVYTYENQVG